MNNSNLNHNLQAITYDFMKQCDIWMPEWKCWKVGTMVKFGGNKENFKLLFPILKIALVDVPKVLISLITEYANDLVCFHVNSVGAVWKTLNDNTVMPLNSNTNYYTVINL